MNKKEKTFSFPSVGRENFIEQYALWTDEQQAAAREIRTLLEHEKLEFVRVCYADQHGIVKAKSISSKSFIEVLRNGMAYNTGPISMDTGGNVFLPIFSGDGGFGIDEMGGAADLILAPDPLTFKILPWVKDTAWILGNLHLPSGARVPYDTRYIYQQALQSLHDAGFEYVTGLEIELYIFKLINSKQDLLTSELPIGPTDVVTISHGRQYMAEPQLDEADHILSHVSDNLLSLELPLRSVEDEWGPGQVEFTFDPETGIHSADDLLLFRSAVKQLCRRKGYIASFMTKPGLPNCVSSGWHLHQSLRDIKTDAPIFVNKDSKEVISETGKHFIGGLIKHANASTAFAIPTINGYKRVNDNPLSPDRALWSYQNRASYIRVVGGVNEPNTRIENRIGDPAANPYLFMASQIIAGLDGIQNKLDPGEPCNHEPYSQPGAKLLPRNLEKAIEELGQSELFKEKMGEDFLQYYTSMKRHELIRFYAHTTDWEHQEYFEAF